MAALSRTVGEAALNGPGRFICFGGIGFVGFVNVEVPTLYTSEPLGRWKSFYLPTPGPDDLPYDLQSAPATLKRVTFFVTSDPAATARTGSRSLSSNKNY